MKAAFVEKFKKIFLHLVRQEIVPFTVNKCEIVPNDVKAFSCTCSTVLHNKWTKKNV